MIPLILIVLVTLATAVVAMSRRNLIHSVLLLIGTWAGIAAFYLWAGAEFVAFAQMLIYVGAVSMVVLFAVLLTRRSREDATLIPESLGRAFSAFIVAGLAFGLVAFAVLSTQLPARKGGASTISVQQIGTGLMGSHAAALLVIGLILTVALLGAVVIAATEPRESEEDAP
ncbi:MAG: NADH-quinone oxidoreductase subunit J [Opitutus sp.]